MDYYNNLPLSTPGLFDQYILPPVIYTETLGGPAESSAVVTGLSEKSELSGLIVPVVITNKSGG